MVNKQFRLGMLAFALVFGVTVVGCDLFNDQKEADLFTVKSFEGWDKAVQAIREGGDNKEYTITVTDDFSVDGWIGSNGTFGASNITVTLQGDRTISTSGGRVLVIGADQTIIAKDLTLRGDGTSYVVLIEAQGNFRMEGNATVTNAGGWGRAVRLEGTDVWGNTDRPGTFTMQDNASVTGNTADSFQGAGVSVNNGTFIMKDNASVSGNTCTRTSGAGVYVSPHGTFIISGGTISDNTSDRSGGGVCIDSGTFTMEGGTIAGNKAGMHGGGIYLNKSIYGGLPTFTKNGGTIYGSNEGANSNTAKNNNPAGIGDALYYESDGKWRNATAGPDVKYSANNNDFWLNES